MKDLKAAEKEAIARFLDITSDCLSGGYRRPRGAYHFSDDRAEPAEAAACGAASASYGEAAAPFLAGFPQDADTLETVADRVRRCDACPLCQGRKEAVCGEGVPQPLVLVVGEGPGAEEDRSGRPFVGKAGQLLDRMLAPIALSRSTNCFITNTVKCRPPDNREPLPKELAACAPFLERQISLLRPRIILALGRIASQALLDTSASLSGLRGRFTEYRGIPLLPTYHPSALLRDEAKKRPAWEDLKVLRAKLMELDEGYAQEAFPAPPPREAPRERP